MLSGYCPLATTCGWSETLHGFLTLQKVGDLLPGPTSVCATRPLPREHSACPLACEAQGSL